MYMHIYINAYMCVCVYVCIVNQKPRVSFGVIVSNVSRVK